MFPLAGRAAAPALILLLLLVSAGTPARVARAGTGSALDQATAADLALHPGATITPLNAPCPDRDDPDGSVCVSIKSTGDQAARGIATFSVGCSCGFGNLEVLGLAPDGTWQYWFGAMRTPYQLLNLPGAMIVCAGGDGLNVRGEPSAQNVAVAQLADGTQTTAEQFVLTEPGSFQTGVTQFGRGGWYRISAPVPGWVSSRFISDAGLGDCTSHDMLVSAGAN